MAWTERYGHDEWHRIHILMNDKGELLARIEGFGGDDTETWYLWVMDIADTTLLRRVGPSSAENLSGVKLAAEQMISGQAPMSHDTAAEWRRGAYKGGEK